MTDTIPAAATGLPTPRRAFLRQLASLPLVGGGIALIGQPTAAAEPVTLELLHAYNTWLAYERCCLAWEMSKGNRALYDSLRSHVLVPIGAPEYHPHENPPSARAALVLAAVGHEWREA